MALVLTDDQVELEYLRFFYEEVDSALGCASDDIYEMIKDSYDGEIPEGY